MDTFYLEIKYSNLVSFVSDQIQTTSLSFILTSIVYGLAKIQRNSRFYAYHKLHRIKYIMIKNK